MRQSILEDMIDDRFGTMFFFSDKENNNTKYNNVVVLERMEGQISVSYTSSFRTKVIQYVSFLFFLFQKYI